MVTIGLCVLAFRYFEAQILSLKIKLDDGRGYYLICILVVAFFGSAISYYAGTLLGYESDPMQQGYLVTAMLLNAVVALLGLTYGVVHLKEGERY